MWRHGYHTYGVTLTFCNLYVNVLYSLSICLAGECFIIVLYLLSNVVDIVANLIHLPLPSLPVLSFSTFSLSPSNCYQAFIMRDCSLLISKLYKPSSLSLSLQSICSRPLILLVKFRWILSIFVNFLFLMWVPDHTAVF